MKITLTITFDPPNAPQVSGPINDPMLCYGLLGIAHDAIKDFNDNQQKQRGIQVVGALPTQIPSRPVNGS